MLTLDVIAKIVDGTCELLADSEAFSAGGKAEDIKEGRKVTKGVNNQLECP